MTSRTSRTLCEAASTTAYLRSPLWPRTGNSVQRIGIKRIFDPVQTLDELRLRNRIAHAQARQPMTLGETAGHNEVVMARNQGHGSFCAKTKVGLINDHQPIAV